MKFLRQIIHWVRDHRDQPSALATLVETRGSTYRKAGARMLVDSDAGSIGVLSGGCLEDEIMKRAREVIDGAPPAVLEFDTRRLYGCNGLVKIFVERVPPAGDLGNFLTELGDSLDRRQTCRLRTCYAGDLSGTTLLGPAELVTERDGALIHLVPPPVRLLLFGAGPEVPPLQQLALPLGWITCHFPHTTPLPNDLQPDLQTAALVMMHHFGRDLATLHQLLPLTLPYVGVLGPRKRFGQLLQELHCHTAFDPACLDTLYSPAGLDLGSEAPEEIALSIISEIAAILANRHGGHLRDRATAIHLATVSRGKRVA